MAKENKTDRETPFSSLYPNIAYIPTLPISQHCMVDAKRHMLDAKRPRMD
ncbi:hypothetical protein GGQ04_002714 [Salinibacter ruber]|nr:hypothetical protein [Salinibacter ruber]